MPGVGVVPVLTILFVVIGGALVSSLVPHLPPSWPSSPHVGRRLAQSRLGYAERRQISLSSSASEWASTTACSSSAGTAPMRRHHHPGAPDLNRAASGLRLLMDRPRGHPACSRLRQKKTGETVKSARNRWSRPFGHRWRPVRSADREIVVGRSSRALSDRTAELHL